VHEQQRPMPTGASDGGPPATTRGGHAAGHQPSLGRGAHTVLHETTTMALYLAISVLALLAALPHGEGGVTDTVVGTVWGTIAGLTLAHLLAFRLSGKLLGGGWLDRAEVLAIVGQVLAAIGVALLVSVPLWWSSGTQAVAYARLTLVAMIGALAFGVAIQQSPSRVRAVLYALAVVGISLAVAVIKNRLAGH
jgi:hypothetical protein